MTQLNDLLDDCLLEVLDRLSPKQLFKIHRVDKRLHQLAADKMRYKIKAVAFTYMTINHFTNCAHLGTINKDQVLVLEPNFKLFDLLYRFDNIKSICCCYSYFTRDFLLEVVRRCLKIECIKVIEWPVRIDEWEKIFQLIGDRITHFIKMLGNFNSFSNGPLLELVAAKCPNIKQMRFVTFGSITSDLMSVFKMLPKSCRITVECDFFKNNVFEDIFEEIDVFTFNWSSLGQQVDRLSTFKLRIRPYHNEDRVRGVDFTGLKKFEFSPTRIDNQGYDSQTIACLIASRFPRLEEFHFNASCSLIETEFEALFQQMLSIKKLVISCDQGWSKDWIPQLPGLAIQQLKNLETIYLVIRIVPAKWQPEDFLQQLKRYVDGIGSLKKLTVEFLNRGCCKWEKTVKDEVKRMKLKQNRVKVDLIIINNC